MDLAVEEQKLRRLAQWNQLSGGPIVEQDCHGIDTINWFANEVRARWAEAGYATHSRTAIGVRTIAT